MPATLERPPVEPDELGPSEDFVVVLAATKRQIMTKLAMSSYWAETVRSLPGPAVADVPASMLAPIEFDDSTGEHYTVVEFQAVQETDDDLSW